MASISHSYLISSLMLILKKITCSLNHPHHHPPPPPPRCFLFKFVLLYHLFKSKWWKDYWRVWFYQSNLQDKVKCFIGLLIISREHAWFCFNPAALFWILQPIVWLLLNLLVDRFPLPFWSELRKILTRDMAEGKLQLLLPTASIKSLGIYYPLFHFIGM